jgi:uncharacterized protein (DUF58 family)
MKELASEKVVISAPMSFHGSAARIWKLTTVANPYLKWLIILPLALILISIAWFTVMFWYLLFGLLLIPYRLLRRSSRKNKRDNLRHREIIDVIAQKNQ